jgi:uncharacterized lipoprotein YddW (UPF0748 family)
MLLASASVSAMTEFRGVWIARDSLGSREQIRESFRNLASANFNAVFVNCWSRGYPLWPSDVFERETGLRIDPAFAGRDVLAEAIEEAKPFGLAVFPWFEYGFVGGWSGYFAGEGKRGLIFDRHPDWLAQARSGETKFPGDFYWMIHTHPDVQRFLIDLVREVLERYQVPGVEFDRARYPQLDCGYDNFTKTLYAQEHEGAAVPESPNDPQWTRWRARKLTDFAVLLAREVKAQDWRALMNNAPVVYPFGAVNFLQDYPAWTREGALDFVTPQVYRLDAASFARDLATQVVAVGSSTRLVPGIDITNSKSAAVLSRMIEIVRERQLPGFVVWYYGGLNRPEIWDALRQGVLSEPAKLPFQSTPADPR